RLVRRLLALPGEDAEDGTRGVAERDAVLRAPRPGDGRLDRRQVQVDDPGEVGDMLRVVPQTLLPRVLLDQLDLVLVPSGQTHVVEGLGVDGEHRGRGTVLRAHVPDGRAGRERDVGDAGAEELDEL